MALEQREFFNIPVNMAADDKGRHILSLPAMQERCLFPLTALFGSTYIQWPTCSYLHNLELVQLSDHKSFPEATAAHISRSVCRNIYYGRVE